MPRRLPNGASNQCSLRPTVSIGGTRGTCTTAFPTLTAHQERETARANASPARILSLLFGRVDPVPLFHPWLPFIGCMGVGTHRLGPLGDLKDIVAELLVLAAESFIVLSDAIIATSLGNSQ